MNTSTVSKSEQLLLIKCVKIVMLDSKKIVPILKLLKLLIHFTPLQMLKFFVFLMVVSLVDHVIPIQQF